VTVKGSTLKLELQELKVSIVACGSLIEATLEMVWFNPSDEEVEGELEFPLEADAAVCGYAVDIGGRLVPGVIVEKEKARAVFEQEVRENKSAPAIAEQVAGNLFKTRIHPFKPKVIVVVFVFETQ
jgi:Ca-activated chloride channel family protein